MSDTDISLKVEGSRATITIATEAGLNVFSTAVLRRFREQLSAITEDKRIRTTVIRGRGKVFVAGADIKEMADFDSLQASGYGKLGQSVYDHLEALPSITVAAINGAAMGGGLELALACDFRVAIKGAKLGLPEVSLGLIPGWGGISRATRLLGPARAKRMFLSGRPMTAEEGLEIGLVDRTADSAEELDREVDAFCKLFQGAAPSAVALAKRAVRDGDDLAAFADCFNTDDAREGMAAFTQKRTAAWMEDQTL